MAEYGKLKGSSKDVKTYIPDYVAEPYDFNNTLVDVSITYEYNFWPYGTGREYRGAKRLTPFVFAGIGPHTPRRRQQRLHRQHADRPRGESTR